MSIKGKVKTYPPYYQTASQASLDLGEDNRKQLISVPNLLPISEVSSTTIITNSLATSWLLTPFSRFIPLHYARYGQPLSEVGTGRQPYIEEFYRTVARREINSFIAKNRIESVEVQGKLLDFTTAFGRVKREKYSKTILGRILSDYGAYSAKTALDVFTSVIKSHITENRPVEIGEYQGQYIGAFSREQMVSAFTSIENRVFGGAFAHLPVRFSQRTYSGIIDLTTLFYKSNLMPTTDRAHSQLVPAILGVVTPENLVYQKLHWALHGSFDLSRVTVLVDRELDNPKFPVNGLRELYYKNLQPWLIEMGVEIWKVPRSFLIEYCFLKDELPRTGGILQYKKKCGEFLEFMYRDFASRFTGPRTEQNNLTPAFVETPPAPPVERVSEIDDFFALGEVPVEELRPDPTQVQPVETSPVVEQENRILADGSRIVDILADGSRIVDYEEVEEMDESDEDDDDDFSLAESGILDDHPEENPDIDWFARAAQLANDVD